MLLYETKTNWQHNAGRFNKQLTCNAIIKQANIQIIDSLKKKEKEKEKKPPERDIETWRLQCKRCILRRLACNLGNATRQQKYKNKY
jgi:hypothetical protein